MERLKSAAVIERVDDLVPPRDADRERRPSRLPTDAGERLAMEIRIANESMFAEARARAVRHTMEVPASGADQARFEAYRAQAERQLQERDARIKKLETQVAKLEGSSSLKLGQTLTRAARSPQGARTAPVRPCPYLAVAAQVIDAWGRSGADEPDDTRRYLGDSAVAIGPRDRLQVAGILRPEVVTDLEPDAVVASLLPHDARLVLERADPDVVLIQSSALGPGQPWAYGGEPSAADVARRLLSVLEIAQDLGRRVVLWYDGPRHETPALIPFESRVDLVVAEETGTDSGTDVAWSTGVQLARFNPIAPAADRSLGPVSHRRWSQCRAALGARPSRLPP